MRKGQPLTPAHKKKLLEASRKYQWPKGVSPNPSGRPARKPLTAALKELLTDNPEVVRELVENAVNKALSGDKDAVAFFREIRDMTDGKPAQAIVAGTDDEGNVLAAPIVQVNFVPVQKKKA